MTIVARLIAVLTFLASSAAAAPVTLAPLDDTYVYSFDAGPAEFNGPTTRSIGSNSFVFSTLFPATFGGAVDYVDPFNLGSNRGFWSERGYAWVGGFNTIRFEFLERVSSVGGIMNYSQFAGSAIMRVLDENRRVLEEVNLISDFPILLPPRFNTGQYRGFEREQADIKFFELAAMDGGGMVIDDLTISSSVSVVPLPASAWLLIGALLTLVTATRWGRRQTA